MAADNRQNGTAQAPPGAGDLIDRAVRIYRRFFWTFILIAAPPVIVGTVVSLGWTAAVRGLFAQGPVSGAESFFYYVFVWLGNLAIWLTETVATLVVMGGASRNFVRHLLFDEAITFRETYRNVAKRLGGLIVASALVVFVMGMIGVVIFYIGLTVVGLVIMAVVFAVGEAVPVLAFITGVLAGLIVGGAALYLFFLVGSGLAYIPQAMLVEGLGVFPALGRSIGLAGGSARRLAALFTFSTVAAYSALALLYVPLVWYAGYEGVELASFGGAQIPALYEVAGNLIWQISFILLSPVWMIGLCLLYVDARVRLEGYDLELMAAARLGEIPAVPDAYVNPLQPALASVEPAAAPGRHAETITSLNLN